MYRTKKEIFESIKIGAEYWKTYIYDASSDYLFSPIGGIFEYTFLSV